MDRFQQFAMVATGEAMADSALECPPADPYLHGVVLGSGMGGLITVEDGANVVQAKGPKALHPLVIPKAVINLGAGMIAMKHGFKGQNFGVVNACTSGTTAIGKAYRLVKEGRLDAVVAGGAEAVVCQLSIGAFNAIRALSKKNEDPEKASRPFDKDRDGFIISEGAGIMVLESEAHAKARAAHIHGEIVGYGATSDAYHYVMPDPEGQGAFQAMKAALEEAGITPDQVDYINAHGTSTDLNDKMETLAIKRLFGEHAYKVAISSTKSMTGHLIGAAGAVEAIICVEAMKRGIVPPTINLDEPDPDCDLNYTPNKAVAREIEYALSNSSAFGGQNGSLVFRRFHAAAA